MSRRLKCQWCGIGFAQEEPVYDPTLPEQFRKRNPYHGPCLRKSRAAQRKTMRLISKRLGEIMQRLDDPRF